ncbi:MAG: hypothetical protein HS109_11560 [Burkholderiales bacterium]|nr:hypothetical protein [Burkholderiales bacterium]MCE7875934.1 hypothetical protein [Betaproteobacteria bacterium PRO3]
MFRRTVAPAWAILGASALCAATLPANAQTSPADANANAGATAAAAPAPLPGGERVSVTIFEFRSMLPGVSGVAATDMFKTALVKTGRFRVVERSRLSEGVMKEKLLNAEGYTTGAAAQQMMRGAQFVFEGIVSEVNAAEQQRTGSISIAGVSFGGSSITDSIAIDVRIVDSGTGDILDAVNVKKPIKSSETSVGLSGAGLSGALGHRPRNVAAAPDLYAAQRKAEGADAALRAAIEDAVAQLAARFGR